MKKIILTILFIIGFIFLVLYSINKNCVITPTVKTTTTTMATSKATTSPTATPTVTPTATPKPTAKPTATPIPKDSFVLKAGKEYNIVVNKTCSYTIQDTYVLEKGESSKVYVKVTDEYHPYGNWYYYEFELDIWKNKLATFNGTFDINTSYIIKVDVGRATITCNKDCITITER